MNPEQQNQSPQPEQPEIQPAPQQPEQQFAQVSPQPVPSTPYLNPSPVQQPYATTQPLPPTNNAGHGLGIASLITSLIGLGLVGLILGIVGLKKSKKSGHSNVPAVIGIVLGTLSMVTSLIIVGIVLMSYPSTQAMTRDSATVTDINELHIMLEVYHSENNLYPASIEASMFPGLDQAALVDSNGSKIKVYTSASSEKEALVTAIPTKADKYQYIGFGCSATGCKGYVLRGYIEKSTAKYGENYTKTGLENPF